MDPAITLMFGLAASLHRDAHPSFFIAQTAVLLGVQSSFNELIGSGPAVGGGRPSAQENWCGGPRVARLVLAFAAGYGGMATDETLYREESMTLTGP